MFNTNWALNSAPSTSNVDWSALADSWMQQREQQSQWHQVLPPAPPPPQFLLNAPPIPPPGLPPMGMTFPPLPPTSIGLVPHHHQLQVGSNTTQESLTMTHMENPLWRPPLPPPPALMMPSGPQWRPNMNNNQPLFPIQAEMASSFNNHNFWPPINTGPQIPPTPVPPPAPPPPPPPPLPPPMPSQKSHIPPAQFPTNSFQHSPVDTRQMKTSFNTSIPSLMDLPSSYNRKSVPPPIPVAPVPLKSMESTKPPISNVPTGGNSNAKRRKIPPWLREELSRMEREKEKKLQNTSHNNLSLNTSSSKFDDEEDDDDASDTSNEPTTLSDDEENNSAQISSTPIVTRRSRFDDDKSTDQQHPLNVSAISRRTHSPSPPSQSSTTLLDDDDDPVDREEQFMMKLRRTLTELLLEVTNEELALIAKETHLDCKAESSTPVIRKASGLASLIQSFSGTDSDDQNEEENTTVITRSPIRPSTKLETVSNHSPDKTKKKKSTREKSVSPSHDHKSKKHQHKKHRRRSSSSSSSSNSSQTRTQKKKKSSTHEQYSEHNKSKKYDDRGRKH